MEHRFIVLADVTAPQWNALRDHDYPFTSHAFLHGLEATGCVHAGVDWQPQHLGLFDGDTLVAALPLYLKTNSRGEFVFDHAWANAYHQQGLRYYPKALCAMPFTPVTGPRLLCTPGVPRTMLLTHALAALAPLGLSSLHLLFLDEADRAACQELGLIERLACHFQWHNGTETARYRDFQDFLDQFTAKKRKNIRQERQAMAKQGVHFTCHHGDDIDDALWAQFHRFYTDTFERHWNVPAMKQRFFQQVGAALGRQVMLIAARDAHETPVAAALFYRDHRGLYGRHWGCLQDLPHLHFETCYYQGIEYAIREGLALFDPGVQGEHKISRGFVPTYTYSAHWIAQPSFARAIANYCQREADAVRAYAADCASHSPYRAAS